MSRTITISDEKYQNIEALARLRGFESVEQFIEEDKQLEAQLRERREELERRREVGREIREFQQRMFEKYGVMPDSTWLIREDRER